MDEASEKSTRIEFYKFLEHPERGQGVDGDGGGVFHGHIVMDLVPHTLMLDDVGLPCPCRRPKSVASSLIGTPASTRGVTERRRGWYAPIAGGEWGAVTTGPRAWI